MRCGVSECAEMNDSQRSGQGQVCGGSHNGPQIIEKELVVYSRALAHCMQ